MQGYTARAACTSLCPSALGVETRCKQDPGLKGAFRIRNVASRHRGWSGGLLESLNSFSGPAQSMRVERLALRQRQSTFLRSQGMPFSGPWRNQRKACQTVSCHSVVEGMVVAKEVDQNADLKDALMSQGDRTMKQKFMTRWYEVGANGKARIETIANYMQEVGANHVNTLYASDDGLATSPLMKKHGLVWVITKMHIEMDTYPSWGDVVLVESWTEPVGKNGGRRDWTFSNSRSGEELGRATSLWVMMNLDTRRLARIPEDVRNEYASFCPEVPRYAITDQEVISQRLPQGKGPPTRTAKDLQARFCDLDLHHHINNVTYTSWFLEAVERSLWQTHDLYSITIEFRQECTGEDLVESTLHAEETIASENGHGKKHEGELSFLHSLCLQESKKELARGQTRWRRRKATGV